MESNVNLFINESSNISNETNITGYDIEATTHPLVSYLILFGLPLGVLLVVTPAMAVIVIIMKNRKLRKKNSNVFYVNLLIADVFAILVHWIVTSVIIICYLLDLPNVNCNIVFMPLIYTSVISVRLMFFPVVINRFLHVALPFSYKSTITTKRVRLTISVLWLLALANGIFRAATQDHFIIPQHGICIPKGGSSRSSIFIAVGTLVVSTCIITGTSIYLRYKIIRSNRVFNSVKRTTTEEQNTIKAGRLAEILQEQVRPTFTVFIAGGIDAIFNILIIVVFSLEGALYSALFILDFLVVPLFYCQYFSHAMVYAVRDKDIRKEILVIYNNIRSPKKSSDNIN